MPAVRPVEPRRAAWGEEVAPSATLTGNAALHQPGSHWRGTSCLCLCHFERRPDCDDKVCALVRKQLAQPVKKTNPLPVLEDLSW